MRRLAPILVVLAMAALAAVALAQVEGAPALRATTIAASGSFEVTNSEGGNRSSPRRTSRLGDRPPGR
jgi:hypothetical protein